MAKIIFDFLVDSEGFVNATDGHPISGVSNGMLNLIFIDMHWMDIPYILPDGAHAWWCEKIIGGEKVETIRIKYRSQHTIWDGGSNLYFYVWYEDGTFGSYRVISMGNYHEWIEYDRTFEITPKNVSKIGVGGYCEGGEVFVGIDLIELTIPIPRCILTAEYSVPSGTHPFNLWVLYGIDSDGTFENFALTGPSQWAPGGQINVDAPGQTIVTNIDLPDITLPPGTYDALTIIVDGLDTSIIHDWEIKNGVLTI